MEKIDKVIEKIRNFGQFGIGEAEDIASAYMENRDCCLEAVIDLANGWGVPTCEAVKRIVEGMWI